MVIWWRLHMEMAHILNWSCWCTWWWLLDHGFGAMMLSDGCCLDEPLMMVEMEPLWLMMEPLCLMMAWSHDAYVLLNDGCCLNDRALDDGWWLSSCYLDDSALDDGLSSCFCWGSPYPFAPLSLYLIYPCIILLLPCKHFLNPNASPFTLSYSLR